MTQHPTPSKSNFADPSADEVTAAPEVAPQTAPDPAHSHFRVDHVRENLRHSSARSGALMIVSHAIQLVVGVGGTAILARILRPEDFGLLAMVASFTAFVATFRDFGLPMAAVHKQQLSHELASGLFWINALASVGVALLVVTMAPVLAWFYSEPKLVAITLVMACGILASSLSMVHVGLLRRQMNFFGVTVLEVSAVVMGVIVGVTAAVLGAGYWSLVFQQMAIWITQSVGAQWMCRWRPALPRASAHFRDPEVRSMLRYGQHVSVARIAQYIGKNTDTVLVGYFGGSGILGLYQKAYQWSTMPFSQIYGPLMPVAVSSFSRLQDDHERYRSYVRTTLLGLFGLALPATLLLLLDAKWVILVLFGPQWDKAVPFFQVLTIGAYVGSYGMVTRWLFLAEGRTGEHLRLSLIVTSLTVIADAIGALWSPMGIAIGFTTATVALSFPSVWYCLRKSPLRWRDYLGAVWRPTVASLAAAGAFLVLREFLPWMARPVFQVVLDSVIYSALYVLSWLALPGGRGAAGKVLSHLRLLLPS